MAVAERAAVGIPDDTFDDVADRHDEAQVVVPHAVLDVQLQLDLARLPRTRCSQRVASTSDVGEVKAPASVDAPLDVGELRDCERLDTGSEVLP